jgi:hypothetical protein
MVELQSTTIAVDLVMEDLESAEEGVVPPLLWRGRRRRA